MKNVEKILEDNLELMTDIDLNGNLLDLLINESFGGNGGSTEDGRSCAGANFYMDSDTGAIKYFGNHQTVPKKIIKKYTKSTFRIAFDQNDYTFEILNYDIPENMSLLSKKVIYETIKRFNKQRVMLG